jgi:hypothetical protein
MIDAAPQLARAAFGSVPGAWPLPAPRTAADVWHRAVAAGGQGRYAAALGDLESLHTMADGSAFASLVHSTRASFTRQLGGHAAARAWDGRAWAAAGKDSDAGADALIGLAADALGVGRFALSARLLRRVPDVEATSQRIAVRFEWVSAELCMATGQAAPAIGHAENAVGLAKAMGSTRHAVKSEVVRAAALCCSGEIDACRAVADSALGMARSHGLVPLTWALACLLADVGSAAHGPAEIGALRDDAAATVRRRGGAWSVR